MRTKHLLSFLLLITAFYFYSCNETEKPVTKEEAMDFAKKLEITIGKRDPNFMDDAMDIKTLMKKGNIPNNPNDFNISDLKSGAKMGSIITKVFSKDGNYIFIKEYEKDKSKEYIEKLVKNEPDFGEGLLELIATYLEDHEYEYVKPFVEKYRSRREFDQSNLTIY